MLHLSFDFSMSGTGCQWGRDKKGSRGGNQQRSKVGTEVYRQCPAPNVPPVSPATRSLPRVRAARDLGPRWDGTARTASASHERSGGGLPLAGFLAHTSPVVGPKI